LVNDNNVNPGSGQTQIASDRPNTPNNDVFGRNLNNNKQKKRGRIWKGLGVVVLLAGVAGFAFSRTEPGSLLIKSGRAIYEVKRNPDLLFQSVGRDHVNILLIGRDVNWKISKVYDPTTKKYRSYQVHDEDTPARSDTMIIVSLDKANKTVRMVSLPRDAMVHMPDNKFGVSRAKLNAAHAYGGPEMLVQTIHDELGITIDRYAVVKFEGFKKLIDEVGGIEVDVDGALKRDRHGKLYRGNLDYDDNWGNLHIHLKPGKQRLTGDDAHGYVRFRMDLEGDPGRIRRQQQVMRALAKEIMHANIMKIPGLVHQVRQQFLTTLSDEEIASAAFFAKNLGDASKIQPITLFGSFSSRGHLRLNRPKNEKLLAYIFGSTFNPDHFLQNSPSTRGDELGPTNNASPTALAMLQAAGVLDADDMPTEDHSVPTRAESTDGESSTEENDSSTRRRSRVAVRETENLSSGDEEPRRRRRTRNENTSSSESRRSDPARRESVEASTNTPSREESSNNDSGSDSPLPVPEKSSGASEVPDLQVEN